MKKLILLSAAGLLCFGADAQQAQQSVVRSVGDGVANTKIKAAPVGSGAEITPTRFRNNAKTTATPFFTETFGSGTRTSLPTGWTATAGPGHTATWHWTNTAATGTYNIGALNSTSKNDGWMIYDSDSIGDLNPTVVPLTGSLISPTIDCSLQPTVLVTFQQLYRKFRDSTYLDVSINGGSSWTTFAVDANNTMSDNTTNANNPTYVRINITSVAANQSNVKIRFRYVINVVSGAGGTFNWLVDDVNLAPIDAVELSIDHSAMFLHSGGNNELTNHSLFSNIPVSLVDSLVPITYITNQGLNAISNAPLDVKVFRNNTQVFTSNTTFPNIPSNGVDSVMDWNGFTPTLTGNYVAAFNVNAPSDGFTPNNVDTQRFNITDTVFTTYGTTVLGTSYYLHRPNTSSAGELSYQMGTRFDIPAGKKDTITTVSVCFDDATTVGVNTTVQLYRMTGTRTTGLNWSPVSGSIFRPITLTAAQISTATTNVFATYSANIASSGYAPFVLDSGTYAVIVKTINAPASSTVLLRAVTPIIDRYNVSGYHGQADTSDNVNGYSFSPIGIATGTAGFVPYIRVHFGRFEKVSVGTIAGVTIGNAYPNPANNTLNVPVSVAKGAGINVSLSNMMGQVLETQSLGNIAAGQSKTAVFNTSALAAGVYLYTVESNGERVTNRVVVAH